MYAKKGLTAMNTFYVEKRKHKRVHKKRKAQLNAPKVKNSTLLLTDVTKRANEDIDVTVNSNV